MYDLPDLQGPDSGMSASLPQAGQAQITRIIISNVMGDALDVAWSRAQRAWSIAQGVWNKEEAERKAVSSHLSLKRGTLFGI